MATENPVLFVESLGLRRPTASTRDVRRMARRLVRGLRPLRRAGNVHVLSPLVIPYYGTRWTRRLNSWLLRRTIERAARSLRFTSPILWTYAPHARVLVDTLRPRLVVYHCVDDLAAQDGIDAASFRRSEEALTRAADLVITTSAPLHSRLSRLSDHVLLMPNVADTRLFATALEPGPVDRQVDALPSPRILFVGAVSGVKVDMQLVAEVARLRRNWSIVLVGPTGLGDPGTDVSGLLGEPNVHLVGPRSQEELPAVLRSCDAGIIPYHVNELTTSVFPMKVYEYLAAGLPVVTTPLPALEDVEDVSFAASAPAMVTELETLLAGDSEVARAERSRRSLGHSWEARVDEIRDAIDRLPCRPCS